MLSITDIIYYILLLLCIFFSFKAIEKNLNGLKYLRILFITGFVSEIFGDFLTQYVSKYENILYHFYIPLEFLLISLFIKSNIFNKVARKMVSITVVIYWLISFIISFIFTNIFYFPGIQYALCCFLACIWAAYVLLNIVIIEDLKIYLLPLFWVCAGFIIFYSGVFFFSGTYNYFLSKNKQAAGSLRLIINLNLNYLYYIFLLIAFICSVRIKKLSLR